MSVLCEKCGADISFHGEYHPNCDTVTVLREALEMACNHNKLNASFRWKMYPTPEDFIKRVMDRRAN